MCMIMVLVTPQFVQSAAGYKKKVLFEGKVLICDK